jgi:hypothetical protein
VGRWRETAHRPREQGRLSLLIVVNFAFRGLTLGTESLLIVAGAVPKETKNTGTILLGNKVEYGSFEFSMMMRHDPPSTPKGPDHVAETREMTYTRDNPSRDKWPHRSITDPALATAGSKSDHGLAALKLLCLNAESQPADSAEALRSRR